MYVQKDTIIIHTDKFNATGHSSLVVVYIFIFTATICMCLIIYRGILKRPTFHFGQVYICNIVKRFILMKQH